jgi:hypothetical protein
MFNSSVRRLVDSIPLEDIEEDIRSQGIALIRFESQLAVIREAFGDYPSHRISEILRVETLIRDGVNEIDEIVIRSIPLPFPTSWERCPSDFVSSCQ